MSKAISKRIEFAPSRTDKNILVPSQWFLNDVECTELEYYGITPETKETDIGPEPANFSEFQEWKYKRDLIRDRDGNGPCIFSMMGIK
jgi:hypothetical protein